MYFRARNQDVKGKEKPTRKLETSFLPFSFSEGNSVAFLVASQKAKGSTQKNASKTVAMA